MRDCQHLKEASGRVPEFASEVMLAMCERFGTGGIPNPMTKGVEHFLETNEAAGKIRVQ
jgi:hypothetical protein